MNNTIIPPKEKQKTYCACFRTSYQINCYDWETTTVIKQCTKDTTIEEIVNWYKKNNPKATKFEVNLVEAD